MNYTQPQGYNPAQGYVPPQAQGYVPPQMQGYAPANAGYAQPQGYPSAQNDPMYANSGYPQNGYTAGNGYFQQQPMPAGNGYANDPGAQRYFRDSWTNNQYQPQNNGYPQPGAIGSYIPQTPPNPSGMTGGYQPYNPNLGQMGRNDPQPAAQPQQNNFRNGYTSGYAPQNQVPLNGGGYVPEPVQVKKGPFVFNEMLLFALSGLLILLFVLGTIVRITALKYVFAILALLSIVLFWMKPLIDSNRRLCFTVIFGVLLILSIIPFGTAATGTQQPTTPQQNPAVQATASVSGNSTGIADMTVQNPAGVQASMPQATPTKAPQDDTATLDQLQSFFYFWSVNKNDEMLSLCAPSWQSSVDAPPTALFGIIANRTPLDYQIEKISGTNEDTSRTVTLTATIDRNNGKAAVKYRMNVMMLHENGSWYVNPNSLKTYDAVETPTPDISTPTPAPQQVNGKTVLYYNPDGGSLYHLDQNCIQINKRYLPLKGQFTYDQVNDDKYRKLEPCNVCNAPLR